MGWFNEKKPDRKARCSFCQRSYSDVGPLVEGPNRVFICTACLHACNGILQQERDRQQGKIQPFLVVGATYRFTTESITRTGIVRTRLPNPHDHWIQIDLTVTDGAAVPEPTWINLLHVHTVTEIARVEPGPEGAQPPSAPATTDFRVLRSRGDALG